MSKQKKIINFYGPSLQKFGTIIFLLTYFLSCRAKEVDSETMPVLPVQVKDDVGNKKKTVDSHDFTFATHATEKFIVKEDYFRMIEYKNEDSMDEEKYIVHSGKKVGYVVSEEELSNTKIPSVIKNYRSIIIKSYLCDNYEGGCETPVIRKIIETASRPLHIGFDSRDVKIKKPQVIFRDIPFFLSLEYIDVISNEMVEFITSRANIRGLAITGEGSEDILKNIHKIKTISSLYLNSVNLSDEMIKSISTLKNLEFLSLTDCKIQGKLSSLGALFQLKMLSIVNISIDNHKFINQLSRLKYLILQENNIKKDIFDEIVSIPGLEVLDLSDTDVEVDTENVIKLKNLKTFRMLNSSNTCSDFKKIKNVNVILSDNQCGYSKNDYEE
ncbi:hypothetical protein KKD49_20025 [Myxococcota bacterium]|nr:hypothetical protein [Myxococcota bacterium]